MVARVTSCWGHDVVLGKRPGREDRAVSEESGLTRQEIEALTEDTGATGNEDGTDSKETGARPDELTVRAQEPEDKS